MTRENLPFQHHFHKLFPKRFIRGVKKFEWKAERTSREFDIRSDLKNWDVQYPFLRHELIVRYAEGLLASSIAMTIISWVKPKRKRMKMFSFTVRSLRDTM